MPVREELGRRRRMVRRAVPPATPSMRMEDGCAEGWRRVPAAMRSHARPVR